MNKTAYFCISVLLFLASVLQVEAQQLSCIEYFWDTDPGYNNATMVSNLPTTNGESVTIPLSTTNVAPGIHTLGIRAKNSNNIWGQTYRKTLSVGAKIKKIEYFWDTDPGIGLATAYTNFTPAEMVELNIPLSTAGTRPGMRRLGMRCMIDGDDWSQTYYKHVLVGSKVDKIEYYFDTDPGVGNATAYTDFTPFIPTDAVELNIPLSTTGIRPGMRRLGIRCMSDGDDWSQTHYKHVLVGGKIDKIEYYFDTDPGVGNATAYTDFTPFIPTDAVELNIPLSTTGIRPGMRRLGIRCMSDDYNWGRTHYKHVFVDGKIDQIEYYFDTDPGAGNAIAYTGFTPASQVEVDFDMMTNNISTGMHIVGIRSRSADGDWSHTYKHIVYKGGPIMYAEYFWDTDPGYEQGTSLSFTQADSVSISGEINTPTSYGKHILYLRARTDSTWSMLYSKEYCFGPKPEFSFMGNDTVCQNQEFIVFDNTEGANSSTIYKWDMNNDGTIEYSTQGSVVHSYTNIGTYTINLGVTNDPSCQNTYTKEITVISNAAPTVSVASNATAVCEGEEVVFVANSANAGIAPRFQWYRSDTVLAGATSDTLRVYDLKNRESIKVLLYNSNECSSVDSLFSSVKYVNVYSYPVVTINDVNKVYTTEDAFILSNRFGGTPAGGTYYINGVSAQYFMPSTAAPGIYELSYEYTNNRGCTSVAIDTFVLKVRETYSITANANNSNYGQVTGSGSYLEDNIVTLQAMPNTGYYFSHWSTGDSINPLTFAAESNGLYTAVFLPYSYNILAQSADTSKGQVSGGGVYPYSTEIDLFATANYGYHFTAWSDGNTANPRRVAVVCDSVFTANFAPNSYTITVASANTSMGSVAGDGSYEYLSQATISATPAYGNYFTNWSDGNSDNPRTIIVTKDSNFTAVFTQIPTFAISLLANYNERGTTNGGGSYLQGTTVTISATANTGYYFQSWSDGSTENPRSVTVTNNITLTANFAPHTYTITANSENSSMGTVLGSGTYDYNSTVSLQAIPITHYHFVQWSDGNTDNPRQVVVTSNATYTAQFTIDKHNVEVQSISEAMGRALGSGEYDYNSTATITAIAYSGYHFTAWNDGNTTNPRTIVVTDDVSFTALFDTNSYTVTVNANDSDMGSVQGSGTYNHGNTAILTASSVYGYYFSHWNDNNNDNPRTITVVQDTTLTAIFEAEEYTIEVISNNEQYGTVFGGGSYPYQTTATLTATANHGYYFQSWSDGNTNNPRSIMVSSDTALIAIFQLDTFAVTVNTNNPQGGSTLGGGSYAYLSEAVIEAVPNIGYHFEEWNDGVYTNPRTIVVEQDTAFTALFAINEYNVTIACSNTTTGTTTGSGTYTHGTTITISAVANMGYHFVQWNDGDTNAIRTITITSDTNFTAMFDINSYNVTILSNDSTMGTVTGSGTYTHGSIATITAMANANYHFVQWNDGNTNAARTITITGDATYTANFAVNTYTVTVSANDNTMGVVTGSGTYNYGTTATITAIANTGYHFVRWNDGDTNATRTISVSGNANYIATFAVNTYTVTVSANDNTMGTAIGGGTYNYGTIISITAIANTGYHFVQWSDGDTNAMRTIVVTDNVSYTATFAENQQITMYTISVLSANNSMGTVSGSGTYEAGSQITISATPISGYHFVSWNDANTDNPRTITVTEDATYIANFAQDSQIERYTITVLSANDSMGTVSGGGEYEVGTAVTITATPNQGYRFVSWNDGNTDNPRTITVTEDATYIANFEEAIGIEGIDILSELTFYPNPTSGTITFNRTDINKVEVLDAVGRTVAVYENAHIIDISKLTKGYYTMRITTAEGVAVRKVVRN